MQESLLGQALEGGPTIHTKISVSCCSKLKKNNSSLANLIQ